MLVKTLMTGSPLATCRPGDPLQAAARLMWERDCGAVPVVDNARHVVGVITDRDICMAAYTQGKPLSAIPVSSAMARQVISCHGEDDVRLAEDLMRDYQVRRLPVLNTDGQLVGMLSLNDLARSARDGNGSYRLESNGHVSPAELAATLAGVGERRASGSPGQPR